MLREEDAEQRAVLPHPSLMARPALAIVAGTLWSGTETLENWEVYRIGVVSVKNTRTTSGSKWVPARERMCSRTCSSGQPAR
jgi:hypothetical protein